VDYSIPPDVQAKIDAHEFICGSDECGLGSWAGPLSVCAAIVPRGWTWPGVTDSKKLSRAARERVYPELIKQVTYCLIQVDPLEFDAKGAGPVLLEAHTRAIQGALKAHLEMGLERPLVIIDGVRGLPGAIALPKADLLIPAVSAGSIIAKVTHDWRMDALDKEFPGYGFSKNAGYGTAAHRSALQQLGVSKAHRLSYSPMRDMSSAGEDVFSMLCGLE
jgi:ribonuclease HII